MSDEKTDSAPADAGKKKSPAMLVVLLVVGLAAGFGISKFMGGDAAASTTETPPPEPGEIANIEPININLANGHFLRVGVGAQLTAEVAEKGEAWTELKGAVVRDAMIKVFSGQSLTTVQSTEGRTELVGELETLVAEATEDEVMKIYLGEYVSQ